MRVTITRVPSLWTTSDCLNPDATVFSFQQ